MIFKISFLSCIFASILFSDHILWRGDYENALLEAKEQHKPLMVLLIKNGCDDCSRMIQKFFMDTPYVAKLNNKVISVIVNNDTKANYPREMYWSNIFPTLFIVDSKNEIFLHKPLYIDATQIQMKKIVDAL